MLVDTRIVLTQAATHQYQSMNEIPLCLPIGCITNKTCPPTMQSAQKGEQLQLKMELTADYRPIISWKHCTSKLSLNTFLSPFCRSVEEEWLFQDDNKSLDTQGAGKHYAHFLCWIWINYAFVYVPCWTQALLKLMFK